MNQSKKNTLAAVSGAFILITLINILSRGLGFIREILFANYFGVNVEFDVYLVGAALPITLSTVILYIGQNYFIPAFNKNKADNLLSDKTFTTLNLLFAFGIGVVVSFILYIFSEYFISIFIDSKSVEIFQTAKNIYSIFLISIPLNALIAIIVAREQADLKFRHPAFSRLLLNLTLIPVLIFFTDKIGIYTIPLGFVSGTFFQLIYLLFRAKDVIGFQEKLFSFNHRFRDIIDSTVIGVLVIEAIGQLYLLVDRYFFDQVQTGGISALNYANNLNLLPVSIFAVALATVVFPKLSQSLEKSNLDEFKQLLNDSFKSIVFIFIPVTMIYFFYGDILITLLFERGKFNDQATDLTNSALRYYSLSLIFFSAYSILNKTFYAARMINSLLIISVSGILIKIVLNFILVEYLGHNGLALSTTISYTFFFVVSLIVLSRIFDLKSLSVIAKEVIFLCGVSLISLIVVNVVSAGLLPDENIFNLFKVIIYISIFFILLYFVEFDFPEVIKTFVKQMLLKILPKNSRFV